MQKYKNSIILTPLYLSALRLNSKYANTIEFVSTLSDEEASNPLVQLEYAIALYESGDSDQALTLFRTITE